MDVYNASEYVLSATLIPSGLYGTGLQRFGMERSQRSRQEKIMAMMDAAGTLLVTFNRQ